MLFIPAEFPCSKRADLCPVGRGLCGGISGPVSGGIPVSGSRSTGSSNGCGCWVNTSSSTNNGDSLGRPVWLSLSGTGGLDLCGGLLVVLLGSSLLWVTVEVKIDHDGPWGGSGGDSSSKSEDFSGQQPPDETDGVSSLVVGWDRNIDVGERRVGITESDHWDVDVRCLLDGLSIGPWVGDDDQSWLLERSGDVVGEVTWGESSGNG